MLESSSTFVQGLYVMLMGMLVVFAALALVMLAIMALNKLFPGKEEAEAAPAPVRASAPIIVPAPVEDDKDLAAAIAAALALRLQETEQAPAPAPVRVLSVQDENRLWTALGKLQ
ncbi:MAG: OadG family protein [Chloroflexi bacterium]|nr:OadG family protein [Chloroflexota bacterium]